MQVTSLHGSSGLAGTGHVSRCFGGFWKFLLSRGKCTGKWRAQVRWAWATGQPTALRAGLGLAPELQPGCPALHSSREGVRQSPRPQHEPHGRLRRAARTAHVCQDASEAPAGTGARALLPSGDTERPSTWRPPLSRNDVHKAPARAQAGEPAPHPSAQGAVGGDTAACPCWGPQAGGRPHARATEGGGRA